MAISFQAVRARAAERAGVTLLEVLMALGVFLLGAVGIVSLFVAAGVLHTDATNRRKAAFVAEELLAEVRGMRFRDVFAWTKLGGPAAGAVIPAFGVTADSAEQVWYDAANFDEYPANEVFDTADEAVGMPANRTSGPILIGSEWVWCGDVDEAAAEFRDCDREQWGTEEGTYELFDAILQPRSWYYVLDEELYASDDASYLPGAATINVTGNPLAAPRAPDDGYLVIDGEWMRYESRADGTFTLDDADNDGVRDRGLGDSGITAHHEGAPVTVARPHPRYAGVYYAVQFYPVNATGSEARVVVNVAYGTPVRLRRAFTFESIYVPTKY
jgi:hypothetical protein